MEKLTRRGLCPGGKRGSTSLAGVLLRLLSRQKPPAKNGILSGYAHRLWI